MRRAQVRWWNEAVVSGLTHLCTTWWTSNHDRSLLYRCLPSCCKGQNWLDMLDVVPPMTFENVHVQSAIQNEPELQIVLRIEWTAPVYVLFKMPQPLIMLDVRVQSTLEWWTAAANTLHIPTCDCSQCYRMDCLGTYVTEASWLCRHWQRQTTSCGKQFGRVTGGWIVV